MSGDGYRARALAYSLVCFFDAFVLSELFIPSLVFCFLTETSFPRPLFSSTGKPDLTIPEPLESRVWELGSRNWDRKLGIRNWEYLRNLLLRPLQIIMHLPCILQALSKPRPCLGQTRLCFGLQFQQFTVFSV